MKRSDLFPSRFLKSADVLEAGGELHDTINKVVMEEVGHEKEEKPVIRFKREKRGLILNASNYDRLAASLGEDTDNWGGKKITLTVEPVRFAGRMVDGIVCGATGNFLKERRVPSAKEAAVVAAAPLDALNDDISDL